MRIEKILLTQFKNYEDLQLHFHPSLNVLVGENGSGKTNLLDAIYFLSLTKSATHTLDAHSIMHACDYFLIEGTFITHQKKETITCSVQRGAKKLVMLDKKPYEKLTDHIGKYPLVLISPNDTDLIREGSEERRKFFDGVLCQLDQTYLHAFLAYNKVLQQRNALLKLFNERQTYDPILLDMYDEQLVEQTVIIHTQRTQFLTSFNTTFQAFYSHLAGSDEPVSIVYDSNIDAKDYKQQLHANRNIDIAAQRTTKGIHKDDFLFYCNASLVKKFGSQGQQKSFVIGLKLAQFELLALQKNVKPLLLLDDIFDKLDDKRIYRLLQFIQENRFGQVFISDARPERSKALLENLNINAQFIEISKGTVQ